MQVSVFVCETREGMFGSAVTERDPERQDGGRRRRKAAPEEAFPLPVSCSLGVVGLEEKRRESKGSCCPVDSPS